MTKTLGAILPFARILLNAAEKAAAAPSVFQKIQVGAETLYLVQYQHKLSQIDQGIQVTERPDQEP